MTILAIVPTQREFEALVGVFSETGVETLERTIGRVSALELSRAERNCTSRAERNCTTERRGVSIKVPWSVRA